MIQVVLRLWTTVGPSLGLSRTCNGIGQGRGGEREEKSGEGAHGYGRLWGEDEKETVGEEKRMGGFKKQ